LLIKATKGLRVQNVSVCKDLVFVEEFLRGALLKTRDDNLECRWKTSRIEQSELITKFISSVCPATFFLCRSRFFMDVISFCASEVSVLIDLFPNFNQMFPLEQQQKLFLNASLIHPDNWISSIKYHTACPMALYMDRRNVGYHKYSKMSYEKLSSDNLEQLRIDGYDPSASNLPPRPSTFVGSPWIWTGHVKRFLKNKINSNNSLARSLGFSFLQGIKRGCATVPDSFLSKELESHVLAMTTPPEHVPHNITVNAYTGYEMEPLDYYDSPGVLRSTDEYLLETRSIDVITSVFSSTVKSLFKTTAKPFVTSTYEPSHNSCFEKSRDNGGAYMQIVDELSLTLIESPPIYAKGKVVTNTTYTLPDMDDVLQRCRDHVKTRSVLADIAKDFDWCLTAEQRENIQLSSQPMLDTAVIPLTEPLKIRTITKSTGLFCYASKPLQKAMKSYINRFPSLVLTTRPLQPEDFRKVWDQEIDLEVSVREYCPKLGWFKLDFNQHVSGDYKAATDKLNINFTKLLFEEFLTKLEVSDEDRDIYRQVLYAQRLRYPKRYAKNLRSKFSHLDVTPNDECFSVDQKNGQLMGSILSFPILCLANLVCYKLALEEYINIGNTGRPYKVSVFDLPVLVNGDDIYFRTNDRFYVIWLRVITIAGFQLSVGKNYVHPNTFTINSQCFHYHEATDKLTENTYLNVGLLIGQSKSGIIGETLPVWDLYNKVLAGASNKLDVHKRFLYYHKNTLSDVSHRGFYNFFLPKILGGLGFVRPVPEVPVLITQKQRQLALFLHNQIADLRDAPKTGTISMSTITMVDKNKPVVHSPYHGETIWWQKHVNEPLPSGFILPKDERDEDVLMCHTIENLNKPELRFRGLDSKTIKAFYSSNRYRGKIDWFGFEDALSGAYPWQIIKSEIPDVKSFEDNLSHLVVIDAVDSLIDGVIANLIAPLQEPSQGLL